MMLVDEQYVMWRQVAVEREADALVRVDGAGNGLREIADPLKYVFC